MRIRQLLTVLAVLGTLVPLGLAQDASPFLTLYSFTGQPDGADPEVSLVGGTNGVLYGTTNSGGTANLGTVFELLPPSSPGGAWTETVLHSFTGQPDGANPQAAGVVIGKDGALYGTTYSGGTSNLGTVFSVTPPAAPGGAWTETVIYSFTGGDSDGYYPQAGLAIGSSGVLYGTTSLSQIGGNGCTTAPVYGCGTVFSLTPPATAGGAWTETVLHEFEGASPQATAFYPAFYPGDMSVVIGSGGVLYGAASTICVFRYGGGYGYDTCGVTVFSLTPPTSPGDLWTYSSGEFFGGSIGSSAGLVIGNNGVLYGTVPAPGAVFQATPPTATGGAWTESTLYSIGELGHDGAVPLGGVVVGSGGVLYGTTSAGGTSNAGTVFSLTPPTSPEGTWTVTVLHRFTGGSEGAAPEAALIQGRNGVLYGTTSSGGASNAGTVFALKP